MNSKTKTIKSGAALAAGLLLLSGCNPAPKYAKPPATTPTAFKEAPEQFKEGAGWKLAQPGDDKIRAKWWEIYNDPQLNALEEQVAIGNQSIAAAEANYRSARALVVSARSNLYPTIGASPTYANSRQSATTRSTAVQSTGGGSLSSVTNGWNIPFDVSYTADFWHRIRNAIDAQVYSAQASAADVATALLSIQSELATDYFELRASDAQRQILTDTIENYRQALQLTTILFRTGIDSEQDVTQAQTQLDTTIAEATDVGVARSQFEHAIATLMGKPASNFELPVGKFDPNPPQIPVAVPSILLERRPDIAALERQVAAANSEIGIARAAYYPSLTLSASGGLQTSHITQWFTWPSRTWSVGPALSQTLFDGGARRAQNEQANAQYDAAVANYRQTVLTSFQGVEDQLSTLRILSQEVVQQRTALASANHYLDLAQTRYKTGVDSYLNVITAQTAVLTDRVTELSIQLRQMSSSVSLIMALGGGWDPAQLPQKKDMLARPGPWQQNAPVPNAQPGNTPPGAVNPPPLPPKPASAAPNGQ
ncbi:MAG TPA: efflux transporter outer membrane subunit [Bryobacteraceae bacterium]|jgi:NodT family efflux transporter outer membrane factor (OMF) lipoprotein